MNGNQQMSNWNMPTTVNANQMQQQMYQQAQQMQMMQQGNPQMVQNQQPQQVFMQPQPLQSPSYIVGRFVQSPDDIKASEVPMDGTITVFPLLTGKHVITKWWDQNGKLNQNVYVLQEEAQTKDSQPQPMFPFYQLQASVNARFDSLEKLIKKNNRPYYNNNNKKKEDKK